MLAAVVGLVLLAMSMSISGTSKGGYDYYSPYNKYYVPKKVYQPSPSPTKIDVTTDAENFFGFSQAQTNVDSENSAEISVDNSAEVNTHSSTAKSVVKVGAPVVPPPKKCYQKCKSLCPEPYKKCVKYDYKYFCKGCLKYKYVCMPVKECVKPVCLEYHPYSYECVKPYCAEYKYKEDCKKDCIKHDCYPTKVCIKEKPIYLPCKPVCKPVCY